MARAHVAEGGPSNTMFVGELITIASKVLFPIVASVVVGGVAIGLGVSLLEAAGVDVLPD